ncbi:DNA-binding protein [Stenotrophomonas terrae]|uniref:DNA-binding protein n=1 Tax=Stenotrophomonas terrae TaxID=405446 RepID=A0A0R0CCJ6_9GAMM|nr:Ku protein [Stenotrophomonas terrae]KRG66763.1 DNA-binding protein [Stenotrophomonas terrae]
MARPIWSGTLSFGLLNVPVSLMSGERKVDIGFRMLDSRDKKPMCFERINADTGEEVPWKDIIKAFEYHKVSYVVVEKEDIASASPQTHESIDVETFVDRDVIGLHFYEKPYVLVPGKKAEKGYVLLRETQKKIAKVGVARVVIRTREYLCAVAAEDDALVLLMLRYPQKLVEPSEYKLPDGKPSEYRIPARESEMAANLLESMATSWQPESYEDEFRKRLKAKGATTRIIDEQAPEHEDAATNVVDFMSLLQKILDENKRTPARRAPAKKAKVAKKAAKAPARKATKTPRKAAAR